MLRDRSLFIDWGGSEDFGGGSLDFGMRERGDHSVMLRRKGGCIKFEFNGIKFTIHYISITSFLLEYLTICFFLR